MPAALTILQKEVLGRADASQSIGDIMLGLHLFSTDEGATAWQDHLRRLDELALGSDVRIHCSINVAEFILRQCPNLSLGLIYRPARLHYCVWSSLIDVNHLLNRESIILPFGAISGRGAQLEAMFGEHLFIRPDSSRKLFTGYSFPVEKLASEVALLSQTYGIQPEDLIVIDRGRRLHPVEWRFWVSQGRIVTSAPYALADGGVPRDEDIDLGQEETMRGLLEKIIETTPLLETLDDMLVMDMATEIMGGAPRLVEINAWSTSGFYPGADIPAILREQRFTGTH